MNIDLDELHEAAPLGGSDIVRNSILGFVSGTPLDAQRLFAGDRFEVEGIKFWLHRDPSVGAHSLWVRMEVCDLDDEWEFVATSELLPYVPVSPEWPEGHYSAIAGSHVVAYSALVDLRWRSSGAEVIALIVARLSVHVHDIFERLCDAIDREEEHFGGPESTIPFRRATSNAETPGSLDEEAAQELAFADGGASIDTTEGSVHRH